MGFLLLKNNNENNNDKIVVTINVLLPNLNIQITLRTNNIDIIIIDFFSVLLEKSTLKYDDK